MLCFQRNWFRADLCEMARCCSKLQQVDRLCKYDGSSTIKVFYWGPLRVPSQNNFVNLIKSSIPSFSPRMRAS